MRAHRLIFYHLLFTNQHRVYVCVSMCVCGTCGYYFASFQTLPHFGCLCMLEQLFHYVENYVQQRSKLPHLYHIAGVHIYVAQHTVP